MAGGLVLGPVVFRGFEVPERITFGGAQRLAVHALPGGGRVVDAMGAEEAPIVWSGVFSGPDSAWRVRTLERLRRDGAVLPLSWQGWRYSVVIERLAIEATNPAWMPYRLRVCVVTEGAGAADEGLLEAVTLDEAVALGAGSGLEGQIVISAAALASDDIATSIAAAGALARLITARAFATGLGGAA